MDCDPKLICTVNIVTDLTLMFSVNGSKVSVPFKTRMSTEMQISLLLILAVLTTVLAHMYHKPLELQYQRIL